MSFQKPDHYRIRINGTDDLDGYTKATGRDVSVLWFCMQVSCSPRGGCASLRFFFEEKHRRLPEEVYTIPGGDVTYTHQPIWGEIRIDGRQVHDHMDLFLRARYLCKGELSGEAETEIADSLLFFALRENPRLLELSKTFIPKTASYWESFLG